VTTARFRLKTYIDPDVKHPGVWGHCVFQSI
jgi:hypothetical protein